MSADADRYLVGLYAGLEAYGRAEVLRLREFPEVEVGAAEAEVRRLWDNASRASVSDLAPRSLRVESLGFLHGWARAQRATADAWQSRPWEGELPGMPPAAASRDRRVR